MYETKKEEILFVNNNKVQYAVILCNSESLRQYHQEITNALNKICKVPVYQAASQIANCWGIVTDDLNETVARELAGELEILGIDTKVIPKENMVKLPEVESLVKIEIQENVLSIFIDGKEHETVTWDKITLIAAAKIEHTEIETTVTKEGPSTGTKIARIGIMVTTGLPIGIGKTKEVKKTKRKHIGKFYIDLFLKDPYRRLRIDAEKFDYTCLEKRMLNNLYSNFRLLVSVFKNKAIQAALNSGALFYLNSQPIKPLAYGSLSDLTREAQAIITIQILKSTERK